MAKRKHTQEQQGQQAKLLLESMGVDNPLEVLNGTKEDAEKYGKELNKAIGTGRSAVLKLQAMQNRNPDKEIKEMGCDIESLKIKHETVEEFSVHVPFFVCAESLAKQKLPMFDGSVIDMEAGAEICLTANTYKQLVMSRPTLKPSKKNFRELFTPYRGEDLTNKRLFVWRSGGIGDLLFIRPILMTLKEKYPDCHIIFATRERYHSMLEQWDDCIDDLTTVPFFTDETLEASDYHISYEGLIERCGDAEKMDVHDLFAKHSHVEIKKYNWPMKCICKNSVFDLMPEKYAVVQIAASSPIRTPLMGKMVPVIDYLTGFMDVVISGSPREQRIIDDFISCCANPGKIKNFARYTGSVVDAVKLVDRAVLVVAPDSSHVHIAAAQGVPVVGIYGPFPGASRTAHYEKCITVEPDESDACHCNGRYCFTHSHLPCHYNTKCWNHLDPQKIIDAIKELG